MRYGKVYFYDRMGNREPSEAEKIREALENFDAPRFRPPDEPRMMKNYRQQFSPLETPPPLVGTPTGDPVAMGVRIQRAMEDAEMGLPAGLANFGTDDGREMPFPNDSPNNGSLPNLDRYRMDLPPDIYPDDPVPRIPATPPMNSLKFQLGENISSSIDQGIMRGGFNGTRQAADLDTRFGPLEDPMDQVTRNLGNIRFENEEERLAKNVYISEDYHSNEICAQCLAEDDYMNRMRREAEEERRKYEETMRRAKTYEIEMNEKEANFKREEAEKNKALWEHVDRVNAEMIELKKRRPKSPEQEYYIFRHESPRVRDAEIRNQKDAYRAELDKQVEEKRLRQIADFERNEAYDVTSNARAALEFANAREAERKANNHAKEMARKQLEFQMEMSRIGAPSDKNWLWWAERPDEHGWRDARLKSMKHTNQVERNQTIKASIGQLEEFKARQQHDDMIMRDMRRNKYDKIREQLHQNSKMLYPGADKADGRPIIMQPDPKVEAAWREAHEKYDKKFRVLQDNPLRSISGAAVDGVSTSYHSTSCRRCARCSRPLDKRQTIVTQNRGETILPHTTAWNQS